jgi:hypothetical protein
MIIKLLKKFLETSNKKIFGSVSIYYDKNNKIHRKYGPAVKTPFKKEWWYKGHKHRFNGPGVEHNNGEVEWWLYGRRYTKSEYDILICRVHSIK